MKPSENTEIERSKRELGIWWVLIIQLLVLVFCGIVGYILINNK